MQLSYKYLGAGRRGSRVEAPLVCPTGRRLASVQHADPRAARTQPPPPAMQPPRWFHAPTRPTQRLSGSLPAAAAADYATQDGMVRFHHLHERLMHPHVTSHGHACVAVVQPTAERACGGRPAAGGARWTPEVPLCAVLRHATSFLGFSNHRRASQQATRSWQSTRTT